VIQSAPRKLPHGLLSENFRKTEEEITAKKFVFWILVLALAASAAAVTLAQNAKSDALAAVTKLENDIVKADLANDKAFFDKILVDDWSEGDRKGAWYTKSEIMKMADEPRKINTEDLADLKVRVYGDTAVTTFKDTYDGLMNGGHIGATVIGTDTWVKMNGQWKLVASHQSDSK
jgi:hypothetical protein